MKNMLKNKGKHLKLTTSAFTLIELLAVIVILAIIALIATPIILGIVEDAKKDAFLRSVELLVSTTDIDIANKTFEEEYTYTITDGNISNLEVSVKNTDGMNGTITYDVNGKEVYAIHNGVYCVKKTSDMNKAEISDYDGNCRLESPTSEKCFAFSNGTITDYYNYEENDSSKKDCPKDVIVPDKINGIMVTGIGYGAFGCDYDENWNLVCSRITSIKFPNSIESIEGRAFKDSALSGELDLSNTKLTSIGEYAFFGNSDGSTNQISSLKLPNTLESIGYNAFDNNSISGDLDLSNTNLTIIGDYAFSGNEITGIKFPNALERISESTFADNAISEELDLSQLTHLTNIGEDAFWNNEITSIKFPSSITSIGRGAFEYNALTSVTFYGRSDLTGVLLGSGVPGAIVWDWASGYDETNGIHFVSE